MRRDGEPIVEVTIEIVVEPDGDGFHAYCPALKGLHTCGETEQEALNNASDAIIAYLHSLIKHSEPIPVGVIPTKATKRPSPSSTNHPVSVTKKLTVICA